MQLMIDTVESPVAEIRAAIRMLQEIVDARCEPTPAFAAELERTGFALKPPISAEVMGAAYDQPSLTPAQAFGRFGAQTADVLPFPPPSTTPIASTIAPLALPMVPAAALPVIDSTAPVVVNPTADAPPIASSAATVERDASGLLWDARIHSDTHKRNADGTWRFRRNLDESLKTAVLAELRGAAFTPSVPLPPVPANAPIVVPLPPPQVPQAAVTVPLPPVAPSGVESVPQLVIPPVAATVPVPPIPAVGLPNAAQPVVLPPAGAPTLDFRGLMTRINKALAAGTLTHPKVMEGCKTVGLDSITALAQPAHAAKVEEVAKLLGV